MKQRKEGGDESQHMGTVLFESMISTLCKQAVTICSRVGVEGVLKDK